MRIPPNLLTLAQQRHGLVRLADLDEAHVSRDATRRLVVAHQLVRMHQGVFRVAGAPETWEQRQLAACLAADGIASHRAALRLWEVDLDVEIPVELSITRPHAPRPRGAIVHRSLDLDPTTAPTRCGVPVTNPLRMLVDLGAVLEPYWVSRALGLCVVARLVTGAGVRAELERLAQRGRRGVGVMRRVLDDWPVGGTQPDSVLELAFARLCRRLDVPAPEFQYELIVGGRRRRLDFAYPALRLAIEVDGFACRTDRRVFQEDRWRQNDLVRAGWRVIRFTRQDVSYRPEYVASCLQSFLGKERCA